MTAQRLLCLGYGYTAAALARRLGRDGWSIAGTARTEAKAAALRASGVSPVSWIDGAIASAAFAEADAILVSTPPEGGECPALRAAEAAIAAHARRLSWVGYLSTNGVYGDHGGGWVDETSPLHPSSERTRARVRAEADWAGFGAAWSLPLVIFRLPGIYGPGRSALDAVRAGTAQRIIKPGQVFSRAHVDDIAAVLAASIANPHAGELFNVADDEPAPPQDVIVYACQLLAVEPPAPIAFEDARLSPMAAAFYSDNKRVSNTLMKQRLGVDLQYPTYREGLKAVLATLPG